jgi:hypothetical protein
VQFDTIYHEHFTYLSLIAIDRVFARNDLRIFDVERLTTHGGSLRVFACRAAAAHAVTDNVAAVLAAETAAGLDGPDGYTGFEVRARKVRDDLLAFLAAAKAEGKTVIGYGAAAKGNTLLNYCGIGLNLLPFIVDRSPQKQGRLCPGSRIPVRAPEDLIAVRPDYVLILPWNIRPEVERQLAEIRAWGGQFVVAIPEIRLT